MSTKLNRTSLETATRSVRSSKFTRSPILSTSPFISSSWSRSKLLPKGLLLQLQSLHTFRVAPWFTPGRPSLTHAPQIIRSLRHNRLPREVTSPVGRSSGRQRRICSPMSRMLSRGFFPRPTTTIDQTMMDQVVNETEHGNRIVVDTTE